MVTTADLAAAMGAREGLPYHRVGRDARVGRLRGELADGCQITGSSEFEWVGRQSREP